MTLCRGAVALLVTLALLTGGSSAFAESQASGTLNARVSASPWSLTLTDGAGKGILAEFPSTANTPAGTLGFRVGDTWQHATRVISSGRDGAARTWRVATTDPTRDLDVAVSPAGDGSLRLTARIVGPTAGVEAIGMGFRAPARERYLGFGERSNSMDQRGNVVESWAAEGPYQRHEAALVAGSVPAWGIRTGADGDSRPDSTYFPMPWLLSTAGYGVLLEDTRPSYFRIGTDRPDAWSVEISRRVEGLAAMPSDPPSPTAISLRFFAGPKPADALRRMTAAIGRQPAPAPWFLGPWVQSKGGDEHTAGTLRDSDVPTSVMQTYAHYLPCGGQDPNEEKARTDLFHRSGMAVTTYFNPMVCTGYSPVFNDLKNAGGLTLREDGQPYTFKYLSYNVGETDFTSPAGRDTYGGLLHTALDVGYDGWMEDFGEYHPPNSVVSDGTPGMVEHNRYPVDYHCTASDRVKDAGRPVLRYVRSGYTGSAACSPVVWGGDPSTVWGFDGLRSAVTNGLTMGLSGVGVWGSDIGGFFTILSPDLTPELLTRWIEFGAFSGVMRDQADGYLVGDRTRPQILDSGQLDTWRRYSKLRTQLYPYISGAAAGYRLSGMPLMQALALRFPGDARAAAIEDQYMFGPDLMVAPVTESGRTFRGLYLPKGRWFDLWRSVRFTRKNGYRLDLATPRLIRGGGRRTLPAPLGRIPVLARAGTMLVTIPAEVDTLSPYGADTTGLDRLADRPERRLLALPAGRSSTGFETDGGHVNSREFAGRGVWRLVIRDPQPRSWQVQAALGSLNRPFRPRCLTINGRNQRLRYRRSGRLLTVNFQAKSRKTTIVVRRARCR